MHKCQAQGYHVVKRGQTLLYMLLLYMHDGVASEVFRQARGKRLRSHVVLGERLERPRELGLVRDVGDGLPASKAPDGR